MSSMSLSAYVYGYVDPNAPQSPEPPQPDINHILPPIIDSIASDTTSIVMLDYLERDVDIIEGNDF